MAIFSTGVLTKKGQALIAKTETGSKGITFTKAVTGSGTYEDTSAEVLELSESLVNPVQEFGFSDLSVVEGNEGVAVITVVIHNRGLEELYYLNELGIFAEDPDDGEILYMLLVSEDNLIYMPPENGTGGISTITERIHVEVTNASRTSITFDGGLVSATDFAALREIVYAVAANLKGGTAGQMLLKNSSDDYGYSWSDINTFTGAYADFPEEGRENAVYIDTDSSSVYVWKTLADTGEPGYFKLPLGSEASETLQTQITANANNIAALVTRVAALEAAASKEDIYVKATVDWTAAETDGITVYTQEIAVSGMTEDYGGTVYPYVYSTEPADIVAEMKAQSTFFGCGITESGKGKLILTCYGKAPKAAFGLRLVAD